jgi:hypothetical protein
VGITAQCLTECPQVLNELPDLLLVPRKTSLLGIDGKRIRRLGKQRRETANLGTDCPIKNWAHGNRILPVRVEFVDAAVPALETRFQIPLIIVATDSTLVMVSFRPFGRSRFTIPVQSQSNAARARCGLAGRCHTSRKASRCRGGARNIYCLHPGESVPYLRCNVCNSGVTARMSMAPWRSTAWTPPRSSNFLGNSHMVKGTQRASPPETQASM